MFVVYDKYVGVSEDKTRSASHKADVREEQKYDSHIINTAQDEAI